MAELLSFCQLQRAQKCACTAQTGVSQAGLFHFSIIQHVSRAMKGRAQGSWLPRFVRTIVFPEKPISYGLRTAPFKTVLGFMAKRILLNKSDY